MPTAKKFTDGQLKPAADKLAKNAVPTAKQASRVWRVMPTYRCAYHALA